MDGVGLSILLRYYCRRKGAGEKQQMLNLVQASKDVFLCWQRFMPIGTYREIFLSTLKVSAAAGARIGYSIASMNMVLEEQGTDPYGNINEQTKGAAAEEGERRFLAALFFSGLADIKCKELKDNVHNSYLADVDSLPHSYDAVLQLADGFKSIAVRKQNGGKKDKGVAFVSLGEVNKDLADSPQCDELATEKR